MLSKISRLDLGESKSSALITDTKHLASYNWIEAPTPTIVVPGSPAVWSPPEDPKTLKPDSGHVYIAQNAARHPESPLEPLFRALFMEVPSFDIRSIDVVTDRNNIRKLLSFVNPTSNKHGLDNFTINVEVTKNTAVFCRDETKTQEIIGKNDFRGFGHNFEKIYTTDQIKGSTGHHRIISYRFGGLNFITRYECDGCVDVKSHDGDTLANMLGSLSLSQQNTTEGCKLTVRGAGTTIPPESILEIKTRVFHKSLDVEEYAPQLWASQTPRLVRAYHRKGKFEQPKVEDITHSIRMWEYRQQTCLKKLATLINRIINIVKEGGGRGVVKYSAAADELAIWKTDSKPMLPKDLYSKWTDTDIELAAAEPTATTLEPDEGKMGKTYLTDVGSNRVLNKDKSPSVGLNPSTKALKDPLEP